MLCLLCVWLRMINQGRSQSHVQVRASMQIWLREREENALDCAMAPAEKGINPEQGRSLAQ
jgi:hypothetical protein